MEFKVPEPKKNRRLRMSVKGGSDEGKTWTALCLAKSLGGKWLIVDSDEERYLDYCEILSLPTWTEALELGKVDRMVWSNYPMAIKNAVLRGFDGVIIDSLSFFWQACLEHHEKVKKQRAAKANKDPEVFNIAAWQGEDGTNLAFHGGLSSILDPDHPLHVICTIQLDRRTIRNGDNWEKVVKPIFREGQADYKFQFVSTIQKVNWRRQLVFEKVGSCWGLSGQSNIFDCFLPDPGSESGHLISREGKEMLGEIKGWLGE